MTAGCGAWHNLASGPHHNPARQIFCEKWATNRACPSNQGLAFFTVGNEVDKQRMLEAYAFFRHLRPTAFCAERGRAKMPERKVLHSWKEVSDYTGRGVRTIQRYEVQLSFPIHRPARKSRSSVLAFSDEIDAWLRKAPRRSAAPAAKSLFTPTVDEIRQRREWLAVAAKAKHSREYAQIAYEQCKQQAKRVQEMIQKTNAVRLRLRNAERTVGSTGSV